MVSQLRVMGKKLAFFVFSLSMLMGLSACSTVDNFMDTKSAIDYKNNQAVKSLDFPPDLTAPEYDMAFVLPADGVVSASSLSQQSNGYTVDGRAISVLPKSNKVSSGSLGAVRWLDVSAPAEQLWPKLRDFWRSIGAPVKRDEPRIGIMETDWVVNHAGLPLNWFNKALSSVLGRGYDASTRDRFRIRVEKKSANLTRVFLSHKGAEKMVTDTLSGWELRPPNHELEAEMLNRLKAFIQGDTYAAKASKATSDASKITSLVTVVKQENQTTLQVHDNYKRAWVLTGIMLDRMGLVAEKRNQSAGIYNVRYQGDDEDAEKRGFFKRLFGGRKTLLLKGADYQVHVQDTGKLSVIRITDDAGEPLTERQNRLVLLRLKKEFDR